jgi:hypothetical protein
MRSVVPFDLGTRLGRLGFNPVASRLVHVFLNGEYRGIYQLTDQMQAAPGRIEVEFHSNPAQSEYYVHWCRHGRSPDDIWFAVGHQREPRPRIDGTGPITSDRGFIPFQVRYPNTDQMTEAHYHFIAGFVDKVDQAIYSRVFADVAALIDLDSFVDFYIVNEFTKNADFFFSSVNFSVKLDGNGPHSHRMYAGPLWDFDQSAGGSYFANAMDYTPQGPWAAHANPWFHDLMSMPEFRALVSERWFAVRDAEVAETLDLVRYLTTEYRADFEYNFQRWPNLIAANPPWGRTPPPMTAIHTFEGQVNYLLDWYTQRIVWLNEFLR